MSVAGGKKIVDISLELDPKNFGMRTPAGFKKDMQFAMEVLKEHDAPGGAGQIVRGVHMRLHAGSHVDAPEHNVRGGTQIHQLPLELFIGEAIVADLRDKMPGKAITERDLDGTIGASVRRGSVIGRSTKETGYSDSPCCAAAKPVVSETAAMTRLEATMDARTMTSLSRCWSEGAPACARKRHSYHHRNTLANVGQLPNCCPRRQKVILEL